MSQLNVIDVVCPSCGKKQSAPIWDSINTTLNPELRTDLFEGRLNSFTCKKCGHVYHLDSPVLYHDMERRFAVLYCPETYIDDDESLKEFLESGYFDQQGEADATKTSPWWHLENPHVVFGMDELRRYVRFIERAFEAKARREHKA